MSINFVRQETVDTLYRRLGIFKYLSNNYDASFQELAEQFGVATFEIKSDLEAIACCGVPGDEGCERLIDLNIGEDYVSLTNNQDISVTTHLSSFEITSTLLMLASLKQKPEVWDTDTVNSLWDKLVTVLGHEPTIFAVTGDDTPDEGARAVKEGIESGHQLEFDYIDSDDVTKSHRVVDPIKFFNYEGHFYLLSWDTALLESRTFRTDRMYDVVTTGTVAASHPDIVFNPADPFHAKKCQIADVLVKEHCTWILSYVLTESISKKVRKDGTFRAKVKYFEDDWLVKWAIENRDRAKVVSPSNIVDAVEDRINRALVRYGVNRDNSTLMEE